jgi:uncharacterized membrane protein YtjA (UPF0391 family)
MKSGLESGGIARVLVMIITVVFLVLLLSGMAWSG